MRSRVDRGLGLDLLEQRRTSGSAWFLLSARSPAGPTDQPLGIAGAPREQAHAHDRALRVAHVHAGAGAVEAVHLLVGHDARRPARHLRTQLALAGDDLLDQDVPADRIAERQLAPRERLVDDRDRQRALGVGSERPRPFLSLMPSAPK